VFAIAIEMLCLYECIFAAVPLVSSWPVATDERSLHGLGYWQHRQQRLKCAFDDKGLLNPGKVFPVLHRCAELGRMHVSGGKLPFPDIPRF
jgi:glycolate oxidase